MIESLKGFASRLPSFGFMTHEGTRTDRCEMYLVSHPECKDTRRQGVICSVHLDCTDEASGLYRQSHLIQCLKLLRS